MNDLTIKTTEWIKCLWVDLQTRNFNKNKYEKMNDKLWISARCLLISIKKCKNYQDQALLIQELEIELEKQGVHIR